MLSTVPGKHLRDDRYYHYSTWASSQRTRKSLPGGGKDSMNEGEVVSEAERQLHGLCRGEI